MLKRCSRPSCGYESALANAGAVSIRGMRGLLRALGPELVADPARETLTDAQDLMVDAAHAAGVGSLSRSVKGMVDKKPVPMWAKAFTRDFRAPYVEFGTNPHFPPPDVFSHPGAGFAIARSIARKGTKKHPFMAPALRKLMLSADSLMARLASRVTARFER